MSRRSAVFPRSKGVNWCEKQANDHYFLICIIMQVASLAQLLPPCFMHAPKFRLVPMFGRTASAGKLYSNK